MDSEKLLQLAMQVGLVLLFVASFTLVTWFYAKKNLISTPDNAATLQNQVILEEYIKKAKGKKGKTPEERTLYFRMKTPMNQDRANELASRFGECAITVQGPIEEGQLIKVDLL